MLRALLCVLLVTRCVSASDAFALVGTVTNTTNPAQPLSADAVITFDQEGACVLKVSPPLYGSGACVLKEYDEKSGHVEIVSEGALLNISWTGTIKAATAAGTFRVTAPSMPAELPQSGSFQFTIQSAILNPLKLSDALTWDVLKTGDQEFLVIRDGDVVSIHSPDGRYVGRRLILDKDRNPVVLIEDGSASSVYRDAKANFAAVLTWVRDGDSGYFVQHGAGGNDYLDRFLQPTGWSSMEVDKQTIFVHETNGDFELFDSTVKPLGIRSGKTTGGMMYWSKATGDVTEFFDQSFKPLGWYSFSKNGSTYYAHARDKNRFVLFDANLQELKPPKGNGFWTKFARSAAIGLAAYGNSLQRAAAYQAQQSQAYRTAQPSYTPPSYNASTATQSGFAMTHTTDSAGNSYTTNSQRIGNFVFSNTAGTNGYNANSTTQRLGTFDYINGNSTNGSFSGTSQRIGNFDFTNLTTRSGTWNGTSNQIGNITFHNFTGPNGQVVTGSSIKIGNFIFTNMQ